MVFVAVMLTHEVKRWTGESNGGAYIVNTENSTLIWYSTDKIVSPGSLRIAARALGCTDSMATL